jgi:3-methylcrotonyl-CoA carboxylase alpha subunit
LNGAGVPTMARQPGAQQECCHAIPALLVANRGEIACRIFRTARRQRIRTIAVYSDADRLALHVRQADMSVRIGAAPARDSYLNVQRILEAARETGATAIHPGYGFLSENAPFAQACTDAGLVFVGPPASAIAAMGSKIEAKARMRSAGVPVLAGYEGSQQDLAHLEAEARSIGLPVIIKPAAGGGGKGMRIVRHESELGDALAGARRLAQSGFGDGALLVERFLPAPRHVEVQVFGDSHGTVIHLGDRDCSIQRRHQKLIEEAPAPGIPHEVRARLHAAALVVARSLGYVGAGTVEFLLDGDDFYFMEMNTRLQVEHTVTEAITGLDLVEWQLRIAAGQALPLSQADVRFNGHAIEARVCAEDPENNFLPSPGELRLMQWPVGESVRVDAGFESGDVVPPSYDSLLGKVISWGESRPAAAARLSAALDITYCVGLRTNERWLSRVVSAAVFLEGRHSVVASHAHAAEFAARGDADPGAVVLAFLVALQALGARNGADNVPPPKPNEIIACTLLRGERSYRAQVETEGGVFRYASVDAKWYFAVSEVICADGSISALLGAARLRARYFLDGDVMHLWMGSEHYEFTPGEVSGSN